MKLFYSPASPFARKVLVVAHEAGCSDDVERLSATVSPVSPNEDINRANSLGKIPTLVMDDGTGLYDSRVICEYLCAHAGDTSLFPDNGPERWDALRLQALGDGMCDTAVALRYELSLRPEDKRWSDWIEKQRERLARAFDEVDSSAGRIGDSVTVGAIAVACALAYVDFRMPELAWRDGRASAADWYERFSARPSMQATVPEA